MQRTARDTHHVATTRFYSSKGTRGLYLDLRDKLYMAFTTGHRKLPDSLAPIYKAKLEKLERTRKVCVAFLLVVGVVEISLLIWSII